MGRRLWKYFFSITAENFLFFGKSTLRCLLLCPGNQTHITHFPRYISHFVIMDFLRNGTGKQFYMKLGTLAVKGIDLHKFSFPNSSLAVRLCSVWANILGRLVDDSWQDNRLPSTRGRAATLVLSGTWRAP